MTNLAPKRCQKVPLRVNQYDDLCKTKKGKKHLLKKGCAFFLSKNDSSKHFSYKSEFKIE